MGFVNGIQREKIRPRHAEIFSMPCACRGVKDFLLLAMRYERFNGTQIAQIRQISAASLGITPKPAWCSALTPLHLMYHHRNAASLGIVQVKLGVLRSLLCILMFHHRNAASLGITPKPAWCSALAPLHFAFLHFCTVQNVWGCAYILYIISQ